MHRAVSNGSDTKSKNSHRIDGFKYQQKRLREILDFLDRVEVEGRQIPETLTDEQFNSLGIELFDLDMEMGKTPPSVTRYFLPATDNASGVSSRAADPIDNRFTNYNKSRAKRVYGDCGWSKYLADAFLGHAYSQERNVFVSPWKQLM